MTINEATVMGRLGVDATTKPAGSGQVTTFTVATDNGRRNPQSGEWERLDPDWHNVAVWNLNERVAALLVKGRHVLVKGRLKTSSWERDGQRFYKTQIIANGAGVHVLLASAQSGQGKSGKSGQSGNRARQPWQGDGGFAPPDADGIPQF